MTKKPSIIVLSYWFEGTMGTASVRSTNFVNHFVDFFNVWVLTNQYVNRSDINTQRISIPSLREKFKKASGKKVVNEELKKSKWFRFLLKIIVSFPTNLFFAEANIIYIYKAYKNAVTIIENNNVTHIFSSYVPYGDHYIAYLLKIRYPQIKWIADFRDLQIEPVYDNVYLPSFQQWIESKILSKSDLVTTVSKGLTSHMKKYGRPTKTVMRGMEVRDILPYFDKFTISYTGSLFQDFRDPRPVFKEIKGFLKDKIIDPLCFQIIYAGKDEDLFSKWVNEYGLNNVFECKGLVSRSEAKVLQSKSHINLLLTSSSKNWQGVLTGKVFEYIESGNTTLCLIKGVIDEEFESLFKELNAGVVVYSPEVCNGKMNSFIMENYYEWQERRTLVKKVNFDKIKAHHSWKSRVEQILEYLEQSDNV